MAKEGTRGIDRRNFLKGAALGVAGVGLGTVVGCSPQGGEPNGKAGDSAASAIDERAGIAAAAGRQQTLSADLPDADPIVPEDAPASWDAEADLVVVGQGFSGLAASLYAVENGASVIGIEKDDRVGGAGRHAAGFVAIAGGAQAQNDMEYAWPKWPFDPDKAVAKFQYYHQYSIDDELLRAVIVETGPCIDWIMAHDGVDWLTNGATFLERQVYTGEYNTVLGFDDTVNALEKAALDAGAIIECSTECLNLVREGDAIVGVKAKAPDGSERYYKASKGVILCSGGFGCNMDMLEKYTPSAYLQAVQGGPFPAHTGEGIRMGLGAGADISGYNSFSCWEGGIDEYWGNGDGGWWHYFWNGAKQLVQNPWLHIDRRGNRQPFYATAADQPFGSVQPGFDYPCFGMGDGPTIAAWMSSVGGRSYTVWDDDYRENVFKFLDTYKSTDLSRTPLDGRQKTKENGLVSDDWLAEVEEAIERGAIAKADSFEELAEMIGLEPDVLTKAVDHWNELCAQGEDTDLPIPYLPEWLIPIEKPPYYAAVVGGQIGKTLAGLRVNSKCEVMRPDGSTIDGLYAGWYTAGGISGENCYQGMFGNCTINGSVGMSVVGAYMCARSALGMLAD